MTLEDLDRCGARPPAIWPKAGNAIRFLSLLKFDDRSKIQRELGDMQWPNGQASSHQHYQSDRRVCSAWMGEASNVISKSWGWKQRLLNSREMGCSWKWKRYKSQVGSKSRFVLGNKTKKSKNMKNKQKINRILIAIKCYGIRSAIYHVHAPPLRLLISVTPDHLPWNILLAATTSDAGCIVNHCLCFW